MRYRMRLDQKIEALERLAHVGKELNLLCVRCLMVAPQHSPRFSRLVRELVTLRREIEEDRVRQRGTCTL